MYQVEKLNEKYYEDFKNMFLTYFIVDCNVKYDENLLRENLVNKTIIKQFENNLIFIDILREEQKPVGFIIYQIDREESDWKERIGSGFIREFYIEKRLRRNGLGSFLLNCAENNLRKLGVEEIYLTSEEEDYVKKFYIKNGYKTNHNRAQNGNEYFEKHL